MKYILRKYVEAANAKEALKLDRKTPVHDLYLKDGEEPKRDITTHAVGFTVYPEDGIPYEFQPLEAKKKK